MIKQKILLVISILISCAGVHAQRHSMKPVRELTNCPNTGWQQVQKLLAKSKNKIEILPKDSLRADSALYLSQLTLNSPLGGVIYNCGGILVDHGWVRILGSGSKQLNRSLPQWNKGKAFTNYGDDASYLLIADDAVGGFYSINTSGTDKQPKERVYYYGPNSLKWQPTHFTYSEFIIFCISDGMKNFYKDFRWTGWQDEVRGLKGDEVISCFPLLWTKEGRELKRNRKVMAVQKLWNLYQNDGKASLGKMQDGLSENITD